MVLNCLSLVTSNTEHCLYVYWLYIFMKCLFKSFMYCSIRLFVFFLTSGSSLYILDMSPNIFSKLVAYIFIPLMLFFEKYKFIILRKSRVGIETGRVWCSWGANNILFLDLGGSYLSVFTL